MGIDENQVWVQQNEIGNDWILSNLPNSLMINSIDYGNGIFAVLGISESLEAVGEFYSTIWTSTNGYQWDIHSNQFQLNLTSLYDNKHNFIIEYMENQEENGQGLFLLFADNLYFTIDGSIWVEIKQSPWDDSISPSKINCIPGGVCAAVTSTPSNSIISTSFDFGQSWRSEIYGKIFNDLASNIDDQFIIVGDFANILSGQIFVDFSVIRWNLTSPTFNTPVTDLLFANEYFFGSTLDHSFFFSSDSIRWSSFPSPPFTSLQHGNDVFLAILYLPTSSFSSSSVFIYRSSPSLDDLDQYFDINDDYDPSTEDLPSLRSWELIQTFTGNYKNYSLLFDGHQFLISLQLVYEDDESEEIRSNTILYRSHNGDHWDLFQTTVSNDFLHSIYWNSVNSLFYSISSRGLFYISDDLTIWNTVNIQSQLNTPLQSSQNEIYCNSLALDQYDNIAIIICKYLFPSSSSFPIIASSQDGYTWSEIECKCNSCDELFQVTYNRHDSYFYLFGKKAYRFDFIENSLFYSNISMSFDHAEKLIVANDAFVVLSSSAVISSSLSRLSFSPVCS